MPNQAPSLKTIQDEITSLRALYKKNNADRIQTITKLEQISQNTTDVDELLGAILFYKESIRYTFSSSFHTLINQILQNQRHYLNSCKKIICLNKFLHYANSNNLNLAETEFKGTIDQSNHSQIKIVAGQYEQGLNAEIDDLLSKARIMTIESKLTKLPGEYKEFKDKNPASYVSKISLFDYSKERKRCLALTNILTSPVIDKVLPHTCTTPLSKEHYKYTIRCGYLLYVLKLIDSEYCRTSKLHSLCMEIFNTDDIRKIPVEEQKIYISNFRDFLQRALFNDEIMKMLEASGAFSKSTPADKFLVGMVANIDKNFKGIVVPILQTCLIMSGSTLFSFVVGIQIGKIAKNIWDLGYGKGIFPMILAEVAHLVGGPSMRKVAEYAGPMCEEAIVPVLYAKALGIGFNQGVGMMFGSGESAQRREARFTQEFCVQTHKKIDQTILNENQFLTELKEKSDFISAVFTFYPDKLQALKEILEMNSCENKAEVKMKI